MGYIYFFIYLLLFIENADIYYSKGRHKRYKTYAQSVRLPNCGYMTFASYGPMGELKADDKSQL